MLVLMIVNGVPRNAFAGCERHRWKCWRWMLMGVAGNAGAICKWSLEMPILDSDGNTGNKKLLGANNYAAFKDVQYINLYL